MTSFDFLTDLKGLKRSVRESGNVIVDSSLSR